jgi:formylglycine-generating enzyme required for sulfatase activity/dienelactone hydrolase
MIGQTISHYRILELLGAGGMGVVYKAEDTRLKRLVALKFLPLELTLDPEAKERLMQEAQAASALDHPNICTIHEIDETPDGRLFLALAYYDGETLKQRVARGPLPIGEAINVASQVARAVLAAHEAGIVHRDIKSANILVTRRGEVKLLDFGLAKLAGQTALTRTGTTVGTVAYMSPEQINGVNATERSDVWALGVVLYEILTGLLPFRGANDAALLNAILSQQPRPVRELRPELPVALDRLVVQALEKDPKARCASAREFLQQLASAQPEVTTTTVIASQQPGPWRALAQPRVAIPVVLIVVALAAAAAWYLDRNRNARELRGTTLAEIKRLVSQDNYLAAFVLAKERERDLQDDPEFAALWPQLYVTRSLNTDPPGAAVSIRDVALRSDWQSLGQTPLDNVKAPFGSTRWKIEKPGFETAEFLVVPFGPIALPRTLALTPNGSLPGRMVRIPGGDVSMVLTGYDYNKTIAVAEYLIDKFEVTNKEYKEFVDGGGYQKPQYWKHDFVDHGRVRSREDAMAQFRDQTGRPGPSTWEVGAYPRGQDDFPVGGVSWYEAAAYAEFRGKSLPTVYHWIRAAGTGSAADITPFSNYSKGLLPVGQSKAVSPAGVFDVAGNVKEWCWNEMQAGAARYILGGAWNEPEYMFIYPEARSPFDRSPINGIRLAKYLTPESAPAATTRLIERPTRNYEKAEAASDDVFRAYTRLYDYDAVPLDPKVEIVDDTSGLWRTEKISFSAAYGKERITAYLFVPKQVKPPYQTVLHWPGSGVLRTRTATVPDTAGFDYVIASGRAVLHPVYFGTFERFSGRESTWPEATRAYRDWVMKQVNDARRSLDYLETRSDLRHDAAGYFGISWGARMGSLVLAQEPRLRAAVFVSGGFSPGDAPPEADPLNFAPRVTVPVLMLNGDQDFIFEAELSQKPLFRFLGSPVGQKKHVIYPAGHGVLLEKRSQVIRETLDWFDRYLGPVQ